MRERKSSKFIEAEEGQANHSALDSISKPCSFASVFAESSKKNSSRFPDCLGLYNDIFLQEREQETQSEISVLSSFGLMGVLCLCQKCIG
jgi:hypothetical protein